MSQPDPMSGGTPTPGPLPDYVPGAGEALNDAERWPALSAAGTARLQALRTHPHAPKWVHACGDRLTPTDLEQLRAWAPRRPPPDWVQELRQRLQRTVPHYQRRPVGTFLEVQPIDRAALAARIADFVPDDVELERLFQGTSSGSTGSALVVPLHPVSTAAELMLLRYLLADQGVDWAPDPTRLGLLAVVDQHHAYTYASVMTAFDEAGMARINLHPSAWRTNLDRESFLHSVAPQLITGPAPALVSLARMPLELAPLALVSGAVHLTPAARAELTARFAAPVLDLYGLKETGVVAVSADGGPHRVAPGLLHVETLLPDGTTSPEGVRGEITVTVAENPLLPLLRYRTGDHARLERCADGSVVLHELEGRAAVRFRRADGSWIDSVELTQLLQHHGALGWQVHQEAHGAVTVRLRGGDAAAVQRDLQRLLQVPLTAEQVDSLGEGKPRRYSSALLGSDDCGP